MFFIINKVWNFIFGETTFRLCFKPSSINVGESNKFVNIFLQNY